MNEIDLFPDEMRKRLLFVRWFKLTGYGVALLTLLMVAAFVLLREANAQMDQKIEHFQSQREITNANRQQLEQLNRQKKNLKQQLNLFPEGSNLSEKNKLEIVRNATSISGPASKDKSPAALHQAVIKAILRARDGKVYQWGLVK